MSRAPLSLVLVALLSALGRGAAAQGFVVDESPTQGVKIPAGALAGDADATATALNPAGLALARGASLTYLHTELDGHGVRGGRGDGVYLALKPLLGRFNAGVALELMRPPETFRSAPSAQRLSFAFAARLAPGLAVGLTWGHLFSEATGGVDGLNTFDLGVVARPAPYLAFAYVLRDLTAPTIEVQGQPWRIPRIHELEATVRPTGTDRLELAAAVRIQGLSRADPRGRLSLRLFRGLYLEGELEARRLTLVDAAGLPASADQWDLRAAAGLRVDLDHVSVGGHVLFGEAPAGVRSLHGGSVWLRISGERYPPLWHGPRQVRRITLEGSSGSDREFAALLLRLRAAERDPAVAGVLLVQDDLAVGWGRVEEIRTAIGRLRTAGKRVFAYAPSLTTRTYYMLAPCERLWVNPVGSVGLTGLSQRLMFFKGTLDRLGVEADFVKIAEYKSAPETFTRDGSSPPAREMRHSLLDDLYGRLVTSLARDRKRDPAEVRRLIDHGPYAAEEARSAGLIDGVKYPDELEAALAEAFGHRVRLRDAPTSSRHLRTWRLPRVAVIFVDGDIMEGRSREVPLLDQRIAGGESIARAIRQARADSATRAIILRINSPGGAVTASDEIAREVVRTRGKKPILCSLGDLGASGGYYVAAPCERIFAPPSTITGSIGIFTGKFDVAVLATRLGVSVETYLRGAHADMGSPFRRWNDAEREVIERHLRLSYGRFLEYVAAGRRLSRARVDALGRGRVWTGAQARARGLVDEHGSLLEALDLAQRRAGLAPSEPMEVVMLPRVKESLVQQLASLLSTAPAGKRSPGAAVALPLPAAVRATLRAVPPALLLGRPGAELYRLEYEVARE